MASQAAEKVLLRLLSVRSPSLRDNRLDMLRSLGTRLRPIKLFQLVHKAAPVSAAGRDDRKLTPIRAREKAIRRGSLKKPWP